MLCGEMERVLSMQREYFKGRPKLIDYMSDKVSQDTKVFNFLYDNDKRTRSKNREEFVVILSTPTGDNGVKAKLVLSGKEKKIKRLLSLLNVIGCGDELSVEFKKMAQTRLS